jgi:transcriptional regulator with XRE-family HTH domain
MPKDPERNHLKAWREKKRMTQAQLAEAINTNGAVISLLEAGERRLSDKWLRRIGPVLGVPPGWLLDHHPDEISGDILEVWSDIPEENRSQALDVLKTFRRKGAG